MPTQKKIHSNLLIAETVGYRALKWLSGPKKTAKVQGVFDQAFYIRFGGNSLISVIGNENYISPTSILISGSEDKSFKSFGIREGMKVEVNDCALVFEDRTLIIKFEKSSAWSSPPIPKQNELIGLTGINLRVLRDMIYTCPSREGLVPLLENVELYGPLQFFLNPQKPTVSERARPHIETLMWGLFGGDSNMVISNTLSLLGLGPGLTPSCDDFLTGLILSLTIGGGAFRRKRENTFHKKVSAEICRAAKGKTTIYSQSFLNGARRSEGPKAVVELVHALLTSDPNRVAAVAKTVINMGETSGADIAIGIFYGIRFLLSRLEKIEDLDGIA